MRKNVAGQTVAFQMNSATDGSPVTSGTPTVYYTIDGGSQSAGGGTIVHKGNGQWVYAPLQAETNGDHVAFTMVLSGAITQTVNVYPVSFDPTDSVRMGLTALPNAAAGASGGLPTSADANGRVDVGKWKGSTPADLTDTDKVQVSMQHLPDSILTAAKFATNAITASKIAAGALDGKGDWNVGKTGYSLSADQSGVTIGTVGTVTNAVTVGTNNDKSGYSLAATGLNGVTLPANIISADALSAAAVAKIEAALLNEGDGQALIDAIVQAIDAADIENDVLPALVRDAILNRVLSGNHDTAGTVGAFLQRLDAAVTSRLSASAYTAPDNAGIAAIQAVTDALPDGGALTAIASDASDAKAAAQATNTTLGTPAGASLSADIASVKSDTQTLLGRITNTLFSGITSLANWLGAMAGKHTPDATALAEINATGAGSGTFEGGASDSLEAIRDRGDAAWTTGAGGGGDATEANQLALLDKLAGITRLADWLRLLARKDAVAATDYATALSEINDGGGAYANTTNSLEATSEQGITVGNVTVEAFTDAARQQLAGTTITLVQPTWTATGWSNPFIRGASYIDDGTVDERRTIEVEGWTGRALDEATLTLVAEKSDGEGENEIVWGNDQFSVTDDGGGDYTIKLSISTTQSDELPGLYDFTLWAEWDAGATRVAVLVDRLEIRQVPDSE